MPEELRSPTSPVAKNDFGSGTVKKLHLEDMEMLFDENTVEMSTTKVLDRCEIALLYIHIMMFSIAA